MKLVFVHGWSVTNTDTYGELPEALANSAPAGLELDIQHIHLGKYISFHDEVRVADIARAFEQARKDQLGKGTEFSCITHSTGGPVIREWVRRYYGDGKQLTKPPLRHLIMLAPANHGSALAQLGKARVGRIKAWWAGVEPGQGVLDWLELGSSGQRALNLAWMGYKPASKGLFPVVVTGESIDKKLYDYINSYTGEAGSDGVVRVAGANLNYRQVTLKQGPKVLHQMTEELEDTSDLEPFEEPPAKQIPVYELKTVAGSTRVATPCALEVVPDASHSGKAMGIMRSVRAGDPASRPVIRAILDSLKVNNATEYDSLGKKMANRSKAVQTKDQYAMVVVRVTDDQGNEVKDYDLYLLAGNNYEPDKLPRGFFVDKQKNKVNGNQLTYYLNASKMAKIKDGMIGFRIVARPAEGFSYYTPAEFRSDGIAFQELIRGNETLLLDVILKRHVDRNTFRLAPATDPRGSFKKVEPAGKDAS